MQKSEKRRKDTGTYRTIYHGKTIPENQSRKNNSKPHQQGEVPGIQLLPKQREMPNAGTPQVSQEDEEPSSRTDGKGKQMEQSGERRETQELYDWVDKLLSVCRHESPDGRDG